MNMITSEIREIIRQVFKEKQAALLTGRLFNYIIAILLENLSKLDT